MAAIEVTLYHKPTGQLGPQLTLAAMEELQIHLTDEIGFVNGHFKSQEKVVDEAGEVVDRIETLEEAQERVWTMVKRKRASLELNGIPTTFGVIDSDDRSMRRMDNILGAAILSKVASVPPEKLQRLSLFTKGAKPEFKVRIKKKDNTSVDLNADDFIQANLEMVSYMSALHDYADELYNRIYAPDVTLRKLKNIEEKINQSWVGSEA